VAQADFGRNLKPALAPKQLVSSDFFTLPFRKVLFIFCVLSPPRVAQSRLWFSSHISKSSIRGNLKSTSVFNSHIKVRSTRQPKVDFGFQVASQSPHCRHLKSTSVASKVRYDGTPTSQAPRLDAKLLFRISLAWGLHSNYYSTITSSGFARSQARGLRTNDYSTWLC
jgi:hypothetical protein